MAGKGSRFSEAGFSIPKSLIKVGQKEMYRQAVDCLPLAHSKSLIFIIRQDEFTAALTANIQEHYYDKYNCKIIVLENETRGQAETVLKSAFRLDCTKPTLVHNCDTYVSFPWRDLFKDNNEGAIVLFNSNEERWSYAKLDEGKNRVIEIKEKKVISAYASSGTYFFKDTNVLLKNINKIIDANIRENNEYYLSSVYSLMIKDNMNIIPIFSDKLLCFGTPQDLVNSLNYMLADFSTENLKYD